MRERSLQNEGREPIRALEGDETNDESTDYTNESTGVKVKSHGYRDSILHLMSLEYL